MGQATSTLKRKFKTTKEKIKKSDLVQNVKLKMAKKNIKNENVEEFKTKQNGISISVYRKVSDLIKTFEKEIKKYEKNWEKETKSNKFYKEFAKYEPYYTKIKANFKECQRNILKTDDKIKAGLKKTTNSNSIDPSKKEKNKQIKNGLDHLNKKHKGYMACIEKILENLKPLRQKEKELIPMTSPNLISPQFLKNKLKVIKKHVLNVSNDPNNTNRNDLSNKIQEFDSLLEASKNKTKSSFNEIEKYYNDGFDYFDKFMGQLKAKYKKEDDTMDTNKIENEAQTNKVQPPEFDNQTSQACFALGFIHNFYTELSLTSKYLYPKLQTHRKKVDLYTDSLLKKGIKFAAPLLAGAIGIVAGITGICAAPAVGIVSAVAWLGAQAAYSGMEAVGSLSEQMTKNKSTNDPLSKQVLDVVNELTNTKK